jgi:hypothetical protein
MNRESDFVEIGIESGFEIPETEVTLVPTKKLYSSSFERNMLEKSSKHNQSWELRNSKKISVNGRQNLNLLKSKRLQNHTKIWKLYL